MSEINLDSADEQSLELQEEELWTQDEKQAMYKSLGEGVIAAAAAYGAVRGFEVIKDVDVHWRPKAVIMDISAGIAVLRGVHSRFKVINSSPEEV